MCVFPEFARYYFLQIQGKRAGIRGVLNDMRQGFSGEVLAISFPE